MSDSFAHGAARASWLIPCGVVALLGICGRSPTLEMAAAPTLMVAALATGAAGLLLALAVRFSARREVLHARRHAMAGAGANGVLLAFMGMAALTGTAAGRTRQALEQRVQTASAAAPRDFPGWYGGLTTSGGVRVFAVQIDPRSALGEMIVPNFQGPFLLLAVGVDNRAGAVPVEVDLSRLEVVLAGGDVRGALDRRQVLGSAKLSREEVLRRHAPPYLVAAGQQMNGGMAFLPADLPIERAAGLITRIDGAAVTIPGSYLSVEQKRALERGP